MQVSKHTWETKKKYSINKESNKFAYQFDFTLKEIDLKDKSIEAAKEAKSQRPHQLKNPTRTMHTKN